MKKLMITNHETNVNKYSKECVKFKVTVGYPDPDFEYENLDYSRSEKMYNALCRIKNPAIDVSIKLIGFDKAGIMHVIRDSYFEADHL